jgi:hypothetical protein
MLRPQLNNIASDVPLNPVLAAATCRSATNTSIGQTAAQCDALLATGRTV